MSQSPPSNTDSTGRSSKSNRRPPLIDPGRQLERLGSLDLEACPHGGAFDASLTAAGWQQIAPAPLEVFQINLGKLCNMLCRHCHVDAGPDRTDAMMDRATAEACLRALDRTEAHTVDLTGGAPELNPNFRFLVDEVMKRGKHVIDRCNLTVLLSPKLRTLPGYLADHGVEIVCSLPHLRKRSTDAQRGQGTHSKSITALKTLNDHGYGQGDPGRVLTLVSNPTGAFLPGNQSAMEREWKGALEREYGVRFDRLIALNNMPIARFFEWLESSGNLQDYMELLVNSFNPCSLQGLMCRNMISVAWDGRVFDCDFNQMLDLAPISLRKEPPHIRDFDPERWLERRIATGRHCYGCTAGAGSSCGGALAEES